jgi:single-strand DNA-binding protein
MDQQTNFRLPEQNSVILVGRLTRDPELRRTSSGKSVCSFDIAVSRRIKDTVSGEWKNSDPVYVPIIVWEAQGERCAQRLKKGSPVHVEGRLQTNKWEGADGSPRSRLEVIASRVQFLSVIKAENVIGAKSASEEVMPKTEQPSYSDANDEDDIPF